MCATAVFDSSSLPLVEEMYAKFTADPNSVDPEWKSYFLGWQAAGSTGAGGASDAKSVGLKQYEEAWATRGFLAANINPLKEQVTDIPAELKAETYGLSSADLSPEAMNMAAVYGGKIGIESGTLRVPEERTWVQSWWEGSNAKLKADKNTQLALYEGLYKANAFEKFLHTKFVGAKRFSVEGNDGIVPLLSQLTNMAAAAGIKNMVLGMAHRGRLNVLVNIMHKPLEDLLAAFADKFTQEGGPIAGDVKYHMGKVYNAHTHSGDIELQLLYNPSHLEAVNPLVLGVARAKIDAGSPALPILIHGDSAVAGQGTVAECNNLMALPAYNVGGTLHFVLNNQVGFTADPTDAYAGACTDIFKSMGVPILHVNADDIEACFTVLRFAFEYRQTFGKDVVIDLLGYRRWGHNEGDDPTFTQPKLYELIRPHPVPAEIYATQLKSAGVAATELEAIEKAYTEELANAFATASKGVSVKLKSDKAAASKIETMAESGAVKKVTSAWENQPKDFVINEKVGKVIEERVSMLHGEKPLNWGAAETTAYGTLLQEGISIRMTGQDVQRGTFSHRHAVLVSGADGSKWNALNTLGTKGATAQFYNSALSENAVMGFEYGYALAKPTNSLVIWEGQFGDFANGAQVIIDQYLSSAESKWGQYNHLTLLLPHGYEGQGPEHSSARLERFLQLCAEDNMRVAYPSSPSQIFHLLRRQAKHPAKKPLIVMTPKSLLRNPSAVSPLSDLLNGSFQPVIADTSVDGKNVKKIVLCMGKVYYDLAARRDADKRSDIALVRVEELYPWPAAELAKALSQYKTKDVYWVQEEPRNMGAWAHVREYWNDELGYLHYTGRPASASPAVGTTVRHNAEQAAILNDVFGK